MAKQTVQIDKKLIEGIKKVAEINKRSLSKEIEHVMTQYVTANQSKISQQQSLTACAEEANKAGENENAK